MLKTAPGATNDAAKAVGRPMTSNGASSDGRSMSASTIITPTTTMLVLETVEIMPTRIINDAKIQKILRAVAPLGHGAWTD
jgi:hypothetical protein